MEEEILIPSIDNNLIQICVNFQFNKNVREIFAGIINMNERKLQICEFQDNEHFSNFESLLLQTNPQNTYTDYQLIVQYPQLQTEKEKVKDIIQLANLNPVEKQKKDFPESGFESEIQNLLINDLKQQISETQLSRGLSALACGIQHMKLSSDISNHQKFKLSEYKLTQFMKLDMAAINALSIFPRNLDQAKQNQEQGTLVNLLDKCKTQIGSRCLRRWLKQPLQDVDEINNRLDIVELLVDQPSFRQELQQEHLRKIPDLDKLYTKFYKVQSQKKQHGCQLVDCIKVYQLVQNLKILLEYLNNKVPQTHKRYQTMLQQFITPFEDCLSDFSKLEEMVEKAIDLVKAQQGEYLISPQFSPKLMELSQGLEKVNKNIEKCRIDVQTDLNENIQLTESNQHTYLFEINKKQGDKAFRESKNRYKSISVKNSKIAFTTDRLIELSGSYDEIKRTYYQEQSTVVDKILKIVSTYYPAMEKTSFYLANLDVLCSFAQVSSSQSVAYSRPLVLQESNINISESRHPCLEEQDPQNCISNDCYMDKQDGRLHIITGPNMGGKSTYIRQVAITVLMAHLGCFVPAKHATVPIVDAIITRVGASDVQLRGISTFMQEMIEASCMLHTSTNRSLVIIDELGRGTSTSEGFGLAWAIAEYIVKNLNCFCLFATHFHEMTLLESHMQGVKNYYVCAIVKQQKLTMLYKVRPGAVDRSYGLFVAEMLKFPDKILVDAKRKAQELEEYENFVDKQNDQSKMDIEENDNPIEIEDTEDIQALGRNASVSQKLAVVRLIEEYKENLMESSMESQNQEILSQLKFKIKSILSTSS